MSRSPWLPEAGSRQARVGSPMRRVRGLRKKPASSPTSGLCRLGDTSLWGLLGLGPRFGIFERASCPLEEGTTEPVDTEFDSTEEDLGMKTRKREKQPTKQPMNNTTGNTTFI